VNTQPRAVKKKGESMLAEKNNQSTGFHGERKKETFEIFKGVEQNDGEILRTATLGQAVQYEGATTINLFIHTFMSDDGRIPYYMLPEKDKSMPHDYVILTRQRAHRQDKKYYWQCVGRGYKFQQHNEDYLCLEWDFFKTDNIYMKLTPKSKEPVNPGLAVA